MPSRRCCGILAIRTFYALKQRVIAAVAAGQDPSVIAVTDNRFARTNVRVALRQLRAADEVRPRSWRGWPRTNAPTRSVWRSPLRAMIERQSFAPDGIIRHLVPMAVSSDVPP